MPQTVASPDLAQFLQGLPSGVALTARSLAHAWEGGGGSLQVGRVAVRLVWEAKGQRFTAGTILATPHVLELARATLRNQGHSDTEWRNWCDEQAELRDHGFDAEAKFPRIQLDGLPAPVLARLATGLRDLARAMAAKAQAA
jgi:hypothetical protein